MSRFQIKKYDHLMVANDFNDLMNMAKDGRLEHSDLVQPEGSSEWLYAGELPKVKEQISVDTYSVPIKSNTIPGVLLLLVSIGLFVGAYHFKSQIPSADDLKFIGSNGLQENEAMLTKTTKAYNSPKAQGNIGTLPKDSTVTLLDKKGDLFKVKSAKGEAWVSMYDLAPAYLFAGQTIRNKYDAQFNAHRKILVQNSNWERAYYGSDVTHLYFSLQNLSQYDVEDVIVSIDMKDSEGEIIRTIKLNIEGKILAADSSVIGTLNPTKNSKEELRIMTRNQLTDLEKLDPSLINRWVESVELTLGKVSGGVTAIKVTQANAIVPD
jgi:hypothetical protein